MSTKITEMIESIIGQLKQVASTETVVGKSVTFGDKMIVPVTRVMIGFGAGGGEGQTQGKGSGFGGGGGGGARIEPVGFIVIVDDKISFLPTSAKKFEGLIDAIPDIIEKIRGLKKSKSDDQNKEIGQGKEN